MLHERGELAWATYGVSPRSRHGAHVACGGVSVGVEVYEGSDDGMVCYGPGAEVARRYEPNKACWRVRGKH